jgi:hypothetical protein
MGFGMVAMVAMVGKVGKEMEVRWEEWSPVGRMVDEESDG